MHEQELMECFFEKNFEYGEDAETIQENLKVARSLHEKSKAQVEVLAQDIEDGCMYDQTLAILSVQTYLLSEIFMRKFEEDYEIFCSSNQYRETY